jgi:hypothetical protein
MNLQGRTNYMRLALLVLIAAAVIFLSGCAQNQVPDACSSIPAGAGKESCVYRESVIAQEPFRCYNIEKQELRSTCLSDSTDETAKKKLKKPPVPKQPTITTISPEQVQNTTENRTEVAQQYAECYRSRIPEVRDACLQGQALDRREISVCTLIESEEFRHECVINLAQLIRDPAICLSFNTSDRAFERDLCNTHAKGGEIK